MSQNDLIQQLIDALRCLPGVGPKSATRMTYHLLERNRKGALHLADTLQKAMSQVKHCAKCRTFTEHEVCEICLHPKRETHNLCIVETPTDVIAIEHTLSYRGLYFVLMGHLSPLDGIGPNDIGLNELQLRLEQDPPQEIILALGATIEGDATCHYIAEMIDPTRTKISRIAQGVPLGGELEQVDGHTLAHSFTGRTLYH
ncbi:MAG: recombination protein RecR [Gammaproteobacteria bacterium CG22_combo_CG10-13_8_21_14_all_40_8]|nr:MAG: recombination protein RecR [Gammaproteobacteria bacterium CG22_combo_CG10-13_8_21_14_all_40_8]